jgi:uncharacterized protein (DUF1330 family)
MAAYLVLELSAITDVLAYREYAATVPATIAAYGGRYLVRGGDPRLLEGADPIERMVILEFADSDHALRWWNSDEYRRPKAVRQGASLGRLILVDGVPAAMLQA